MIATILKKLGDVPNKGGCNTFINPFSYMMLRKQKDLLECFDSVMVDGQLLLRLINAIFSKSLTRRSFDMTSLAPTTFAEAIEDGQTVYLIGSDEFSVNKAVQRFQKRFPSLRICGWRDGYFRSQEERKEALFAILKLAPAIVIVGMGTPRQEQFLVDLRISGWIGTGYTCGGFFHQTARNIDYYPKWANQLQLRWLYRILDEPKLWRRYLIDYSCFLFLFLGDVVKYKLKAKTSCVV